VLLLPLLPQASSVEEANKWMKIIIDILVNAPEDDGNDGE
jgi:hypothetical protein